MSRVTIAEWYRRVNAAWGPNGKPTTPPTPIEAVRAARRLYRFERVQTFPADRVRLTSGRRFTYVRRGTMFVNPDRPGSDGGGWAALVHDLSHHLHYLAHPDVRPHGPDHARLEIRLIKEVVRRGWLSGALRDPEPDEPPPPEVAAANARAAALARLQARRKAWQTKAKRAATALRKIARQEARLLRATNPRLAAAIAQTVENPTGGGGEGG